MLEWFLGGISREMIWATMVVFLIGVAGSAFIDIVAAKMFDAKGKLKWSRSSIVLSIIVLFFEELIFRGPIYLISIFKEFLGFWSLIIIWSSIIIWGGIIFGLIHWYTMAEKDGTVWKELPNKAYRFNTTIVAVFGGILLGWLVMATNSLIPAIIVHGMLNLIHGSFLDKWIYK